MKKNFIWKGISKEGACEKGIIEASNIRLARAYLIEKGVHTFVYVRRNTVLARLRFHRQQHLKFSDITLFLKHLATLLSAGIPLIKALDIVQLNFSSAFFKKWIQEIHQNVAAGYTLSIALKRYPKFIPLLVCDWIESGEKSGKLEVVLNQLALERERQNQYTQKIKSLLIYPSFVMVMALALVMALFIWVIPQWSLLFAGSQVQLPLLTRVILFISAFIRNEGWILLLSTISGWMIIRFICLKKPIGPKWRQLQWKIPYLRGVCRDHFLMNWSQLLALSLSAGIPLISALQSLKDNHLSSPFQESMCSILSDLETGHSFTNAIHKTNQFPPYIRQMISIGEESGHLEEMIQKAGEFYQLEFERKIRNLLQLLEPFIITALGIIVGLIVMGMYLPIFQLGNVV